VRSHGKVGRDVSAAIKASVVQGMDFSEMMEKEYLYLFN
jgi:hypothetical protein